MAEEETEFFIDVLREENLERLQEIEKIVSEKPRTYDPNSIFLRKFLLAAFKLSEEKKKKSLLEKASGKAEEKKPEIKKEAKVAEKKAEKKEEVKLVVPRPVILKPLEMPKPQFPEYPLVVTKDTNKVLVRASLKDNTYYLDEPKMENSDLQVLSKLKEEIGKKLVKNPKLADDRKYLSSIIQKLARKFNVNFDDDYYEKLKYYLVRDVAGFGVIDSMLRDGNIKEIYCDGVGKTLHITYNNDKVETKISYDSNREIDGIINKFALLSGKKPNNEPFFEAVYNNITLKAIRGLGIVESKFTISRL